jgi:argininosuccinate synthase
MWGSRREDIADAAERAKILGTEHYTVDARAEFAADYCIPAVKANADYQGYPLSTAIARPLIAQKARRNRADTARWTPFARTAAPARATTSSASSLCCAR